MINFDNIPSIIQQHKAFLVWKFEQLEDGKKPLKVPMYTNGRWRKGSQGTREDRQQLVPFNTALSILAKSKKNYSGLGMALLPDWGLVAVDFDDCVQNGEVVPEVYYLVEPTYWEFSPSGNGVRAFFKGHLRDGKSISAKAKEADGGRGWGVEFFCSKGFVTITGNVATEVELVGSNDVIPLTKEIKELHSRTIGSRSASTDNKEQAVVGMTDDEIKRMLEDWDADCDYDTWMNVGMALHHETDGEGFDLWNDWSSKGSDYPGAEQCQYKWESFGRSGKKSLKTVRWMINEKGLDFDLEAGTDDGEFKPLGPLKDKDEEERRAAIHKMTVKSSGMVEPTMTGMYAALNSQAFCGWAFRKDTFLCKTLTLPPEENSWRELQDEDFTKLVMLLEQKNFDKPHIDKVRKATLAVARDHQINSAQEWLESLPLWDGIERIHRYAQDFLGATDEEEYVQAVSTYAWTAHAGRVLEPGVKADMMPVLIGAQNIGKSSNVMAIAPEMSLYLTMDFSNDRSTSPEYTVGKVVVECAELQGLSKRDVNKVKSYITAQEERYRFPYDRLAQDIRRTFIMWGTTNDEQFLSDPTGNRRFLPLQVVGTGDKRFTTSDRDLFWAEAREKFKEHGIMCTEEANRLAEPYRERAMLYEPWEGMLISAMETTIGDSTTKLKNHEYLITEDILTYVCGVPAERQNPHFARRLAAVLRKLGYVQTENPIKVADGSRKRVWIKQKGDD